MKNFSKTFLISLLFITCQLVFAQDFQTGLIAENTPWQTEYYIIDSNQPGPTVMITAGLHGNEPAGALAAEQIKHWPIDRGRLIIVPKANKPGLEKNKRNMPGKAKPAANLNRNFPKKNAPGCKCLLSKELWQLVRDQDPDWLIDLHEGYGFAKVNKKSVGSSILTSLPVIKQQARSMLKALNLTIGKENKKFVLKGKPVIGSLARAAADRLDIKSFIIETTRVDQRLSLRSRQHQIMLSRLLDDLEMIDMTGISITQPPNIKKAEYANAN